MDVRVILLEIAQLVFWHAIILCVTFIQNFTFCLIKIYKYIVNTILLELFIIWIFSLDVCCEISLIFWISCVLLYIEKKNKTARVPIVQVVEANNVLEGGNHHTFCPLSFFSTLSHCKEDSCETRILSKKGSNLVTDTFTKVYKSCLKDKLSPKRIKVVSRINKTKKWRLYLKCWNTIKSIGQPKGKN